MSYSVGLGSIEVPVEPGDVESAEVVAAKGTVRRPIGRIGMGLQHSSFGCKDVQQPARSARLPAGGRDDVSRLGETHPVDPAMGPEVV